MAPYQGRESGSLALDSSSSLFQSPHGHFHGIPASDSTGATFASGAASSAPSVHSPTGSDSDDRSPTYGSQVGGRSSRQHGEALWRVEGAKADIEFGPPPGLARIAVGNTCSSLPSQHRQHHSPEQHLRPPETCSLQCHEHDTDMQCNSPSPPVKFQRTFANVDDYQLDALIEETVGDGLLGDGLSLF